jgi:hypothetical protein
MVSLIKSFTGADLAHFVDENQNLRAIQKGELFQVLVRYIDGLISRRGNLVKSFE